MTFVSYAQNFEDVILWRALKEVGIGFYIDVGANDPSADSVTKAFYDRGWNGVNCEPLLSHFKDLQRERPRDINLQVAIGEAEGEIDVWECDVRGWATSERSVIEAWENAGIKGVAHRVPLLTLNQVCADLPPGQMIHFLKIDVEGAEDSVLRGINFLKYRPWIVIVEACLPNSTQPNFMKWDHRLTTCDYTFVYSDGLNRFYLAREHISLSEHFKSPPNVFDQFISSGQHIAMLKADSAAQHALRAERAESRAERAESRAERAESNVNSMQLQLQATLASRSWRVTAPLRWFGTQARRLRDEGLQARLEALVKKGAMHSDLRLGLYNKMRIAAHRLSSLITFNRIFGGKTTPFELHNMSSISKSFYENLRQAIEALNKGSR